MTLPSHDNIYLCADKQNAFNQKEDVLHSKLSYISP